MLSFLKRTADKHVFQIEKQPDDTTCGPTCLHAVYVHYGDVISLDRIIKEVPAFAQGGTLAVHLGCHALKRGYKASLYTYNLQMFDPTWFRNPQINLKKKLFEQMKYKKGKRFYSATAAYLKFLTLGGEIRFKDLTKSLIVNLLRNGTPLLTGLCATYLYNCARERDVSPVKTIFDDIRGTPTGHFIVMTSFDSIKKRIHIADPYHDNPSFFRSHYTVTSTKLINAIMLGILTYDANILQITKKRKTEK